MARPSSGFPSASVRCADGAKLVRRIADVSADGLRLSGPDPGTRLRRWPPVGPWAPVIPVKVGLSNVGGDSAVRVMLLALNREQRQAYLEEALGEGAAQLRTQIEGDRVLDELTRTPLILSEVTTIFRAGGHVPKTKARVLSRVMQLIEQAEEHRDHLERPPLSGHARDYLAVLAVEMTSQGGVGLEQTRARALIHSETHPVQRPARAFRDLPHRLCQRRHRWAGSFPSLFSATTWFPARPPTSPYSLRRVLQRRSN